MNCLALLSNALQKGESNIRATNDALEWFVLASFIAGFRKIKKGSDDAVKVTEQLLPGRVQDSARIAAFVRRAIKTSQLFFL